MGDVIPFDPELARWGLMTPLELDGRRVVQCMAVERAACFVQSFDAWFIVDGREQHVMATTNDGGRNWDTVLGNHP